MDLKEILHQLNATPLGDYYILICPVCGRKEAYLYVDDIIKFQKDNSHKIPIRCNRLNKCGHTSYLNDIADLKISKLPKQHPTIQIKEEGIQLIQKLVNYYCFTLNGNSTDFDFSIRGISNSTLKSNNIMYVKSGFENIINTSYASSLFSNKYRQKHYNNRDIFIPIFNYNNECERILLRSKTPEPSQEKKEIQLLLKQGGIEIWNIKDLIADNKYVFITEGVYDALSFKEINASYGVISLPGVRKYKKLIKEIKNNIDICKKKLFIIATDNDDAGKEYALKLYNSLTNLNINCIFFDLGKYKDANDFLRQNKLGFMLAIKKATNQ